VKRFHPGFSGAIANADHCGIDGSDLVQVSGSSGGIFLAINAFQIPTITLSVKGSSFQRI
jgi:hypothetical protein